MNGGMVGEGVLCTWEVLREGSDREMDGECVR
jgi:hypothetical protein